MYNFGSPKVGNNLFAKAFTEAVDNSWRLVNGKDIVPYVPNRLGTYVHVEKSVYKDVVKAEEDGKEGR